MLWLLEEGFIPEDTAQCLVSTWSQQLSIAQWKANLAEHGSVIPPHVIYLSTSITKFTVASSAYGALSGIAMGSN